MASSTSNRKNDNNSSKSSENNMSLWKRMLQPGAHWEDKEEFLDVIYWSRQIVAVIIGIIWGLLGFTGFFGISSFAAVNSAFVYIYSINFNEDQEDLLEYVKEGFMTAFSAFMVAWIVTYSAVFYGSDLPVV